MSIAPHTLISPVLPVINNFVDQDLFVAVRQMHHAYSAQTCVMASLLCVFCVVGYGQDTGGSAAVPMAKQDLAKLEAKHEERREAFREAIATASAENDRDRIAEEHEDFRDYWLPAIHEMLTIANEQPSTPIGKRAALWVLNNCGADYDQHVRAAEILLEHHSRSEELGTAYIGLYGFHPVYEKLLRVVATSDPSPSSRAHATFKLAELLVLRSDLKDGMDATPELRSERIENMGEPVVEHLESTDPEQDRAEAKQLYKTIQREFSDVAYRDRTLGDIAAERLMPLEQIYPEIGKAAPSITGRDLRGKPLALEDHRGKVVVISFWASWCGPCLSRVPAENQLIEHFKDGPFVLLGVNGDASVEDAIQAAEEHDVRFTSWWDNPADDTRIVDRYGVSSWPTVFVLDQDGIIRNKNLFGSDLHKAVGRLLNTAATATGNGEQADATEPADGPEANGRPAAPAR